MNSTQSTPQKKSSGLKALMKEYGYAGLGVYLGLSAIDLPLCYILVHSMGQEEIEYYENRVKQTFGYGMSDEELQRKQEINRIHDSTETEDSPQVKDDALWSKIYHLFSWTEFAIAYGIHKSLIFIRLPIAAAVTPGIVKVLRGWGFRIGTDKLSTTANIARDGIRDFTAANPKFGTRANGKKRWFSWFF